MSRVHCELGSLNFVHCDQHLLGVVESVGLLYRHLRHGHLQLLLHLHLLLQLLGLQLEVNRMRTGGENRKRGGELICCPLKSIPQKLSNIEE